MLNAVLNQILKNSIAQRWFIVAGAIAITIWGVFSVTQMPLDVFPPFAPPQVDLQVEAVGWWLGEIIPCPYFQACCRPGI